MKKWTFALLVLAGLSCSRPTATALEPGWSGNVVAFGRERARIEATPIIYRNYRPFHFYGNTVRRRYYHGTAVPRPGNMVRGPRAFARAR
jgi:hypothetical protein